MSHLKFKIAYTIREAAKIAGVHPDTVRRQIHRGQILAQIIHGFVGFSYSISPTQLKRIKRHPGGRPKLA